MADEGDQSVQLQEDALRVALANHASKPRTDGLVPTGFCHYCKDPVDPGEPYCNDDCKDDYLYEQSRRRR